MTATTFTLSAPGGIPANVTAKSGAFYSADSSQLFTGVAPQDVGDLISSGAVPLPSGGGIGAVKIVTSGSSYSLTSGVTFVGVDKTTGSATAVILDVTNMQINMPVTVADQKADAATNNITITESSGVLINGAASFVINANREAVSCTYDGTAITIT